MLYYYPRPASKTHPPKYCLSTAGKDQEEASSDIFLLRRGSNTSSWSHRHHVMKYQATSINYIEIKHIHIYCPFRFNPHEAFYFKRTLPNTGGTCWACTSETGKDIIANSFRSFLTENCMGALGFKLAVNTHRAIESIQFSFRKHLYGGVQLEMSRFNHCRAPSQWNMQIQRWWTMYTSHTFTSLPPFRAPSLVCQ